MSFIFTFSPLQMWFKSSPLISDFWFFLIDPSSFFRSATIFFLVLVLPGLTQSISPRNSRMKFRFERDQSIRVSRRQVRWTRDSSWGWVENSSLSLYLYKISMKSKVKITRSLQFQIISEKMIWREHFKSWKAKSIVVFDTLSDLQSQSRMYISQMLEICWWWSRETGIDDVGGCRNQPDLDLTPKSSDSKTMMLGFYQLLFSQTLSGMHVQSTRVNKDGWGEYFECVVFASGGRCAVTCKILPSQSPSWDIRHRHLPALRAISQNGHGRSKHISAKQQIQQEKEKGKEAVIGKSYPHSSAPLVYPFPLSLLSLLPLSFPSFNLLHYHSHSLSFIPQLQVKARSQVSLPSSPFSCHSPPAHLPARVSSSSDFELPLSFLLITSRSSISHSGQDVLLFAST